MIWAVPSWQTVKWQCHQETKQESCKAHFSVSIEILILMPYYHMAMSAEKEKELQWTPAIHLCVQQNQISRLTKKFKCIT